MAAKNGGFLDMDKFTFCGRVIQAISEMIMEDTIQGPDINSIHTVFPDIVTNTEVGYIGEGGMVGVVNTGCNPTPQPWNINTRKLKWEPGIWEILLSQCYTDLQQSATIYSLRTGVDIPDFTDTDYMNIVIEVLERSIMDFWYRLFWFNDKDAKNVTDSGIITDGLLHHHQRFLETDYRPGYSQSVPARSHHYGKCRGILRSSEAYSGQGQGIHSVGRV